MHNNRYAPWARMIMSDDAPGGAGTEDASAPTTAAQSPEAGVMGGLALVVVSNVVLLFFGCSKSRISLGVVFALCPKICAGLGVA
jgi:hypothetical protein